MTDELTTAVKRQHTTELILPNPKTDGSRLVCKVEREIRTQIPPTVDQQSFLAACVVEANKLPPDTAPASVAIAVMNLGVLGLIPGPALGHAYLVAFNNRQAKARLAQVVVGYKGFIDLALGNSFLKSVHADVVCRDEEFRHWKDANGPQMYHEPAIDRNPSEADIVAAYCVYQTAAGGHGIVVIPKSEIQKAKKDSDPWRYSYAAMAAKTAVRRASKEWRLTRGLANAVMLDEQAERGDEQTRLAPLELPTLGPSQSPDAPAAHPRGNRATTDERMQVHRNWVQMRDATGFPADDAEFLAFVQEVTGMKPDDARDARHWNKSHIRDCQAAIDLAMESEGAIDE